VIALAPEQLKETLLFLATAGLVVPVFRRLRLSPVIGFLSAGAALGPHGLGALAQNVPLLHSLAFDSPETIEPVADFGVVFLLFMIGLELSFERLSRLGRLVFGLGALQLASATILLGILAFAVGEKPAGATILGAGLALSSTAVVIPVMAERRRLGTTAGRTVFSVLLFQDLMVAPLLVLVTMLSVRTDQIWVVLASTLLPALLAILLLVWGGRYLLRPLFHHVVEAGSTELFMAACLFVVIGTGVLTAAAGLSMGLGAFIAGLLLAETEYRREIEVMIDPFKGLLLGLFFVAVGAGLDTKALWYAPQRTLGLALGFMILKALSTYVSARAMRLPWRPALEAALMLAPGGEFAFVLIGAAAASHLLPPASVRDVDMAVTLSLFAIPFLAAVARRLTRALPRADEDLSVPPPVRPNQRRLAPFSSVMAGSASSSAR
jgi:CPA2 family monovalent cation:H+ antiporter-2